ncbi:hypothetical protein VJI72_08350, partial [Parvimonas micra]|uniref:hypothetical protein n=1 Tax=Parvimonas micra TaxID=33033 RepID=UPI002B49D476
SLLGEQLKDMVQEDPVDRAALLKELDRIEGTIGRISRVTNSMREFAHGVSRSTPTRRTVRSLVEDLLMFCEHEIAKRSIDVKTDLSAAG